LRDKAQEECLAKDMESTYEDAKYYLDEFTKNKTDHLDKDISFIEAITCLNEKYIKDYDTANYDDKKKLTKDFKVKWDYAIRNKDIYGFKYNELLHRVIPEMIRFSTYTDTDQFYLQVGDGNFCTVAEMPDNIINSLINTTAGKIPAWTKTCREGALNASKHIGEFGNIDVYFQSTQNGKYQFLKITIHGKYSRQALIETQDVFVDELNYMCLINKMMNRELILQKKHDSNNNGDLLN